MSWKIWSRICRSTVRRATYKVALVSPTPTRTSEKRNFVRSRKLTTRGSPDLSHAFAELWHELVTGAVDRSEMHWVRRVFLKLLPKLQNVIVHGSGRRIALIAPNLIQ